MKHLKYFIALVFVCNSVIAQRLSLDFDSGIPKTKASQLEIKGDITDLIWVTYSPDPLQGMFSNSTEIYKFENNLLKSRNSIDWGEVYTYAYNNEVLQSESWVGSTSGYHLFKTNGNTLTIFKSGNLDKPYSTIVFDKYGRFSKVTKPNSSFDIVYVDSQRGSKIKQKTETINHLKDDKQIASVNSTTFEYFTKLWNGKEVRVEKAIQTSNNIANNTKTITYDEVYYDKMDRIIYSKSTHEDGSVFQEGEYFYKDDAAGNWVTKTHFNTISNSIVFVEQRKITYANGLVSGRDEIKKEFVKKLSIPQIKNKYSYYLINEQGQFTLIDPAGNSIGWRTKHLGYNKTDNYYLIDTDINALIELTNFKNASLKSYNEAKIISLGYSSFYYVNQGGDVICINNSLIKNYEFTETSKATFILYDKDGDKSYTLALPSNANIGSVIPIDILPDAKNNAYYMPIETPNKTRFIFLIEKGVYISPSKENMVISKKGIYVKGNVGFYLIENHLSEQLWSIKIPKVISENEFKKAMEAHEKLINPETTNKVLADNTTTLPKEISTSNFGCGVNDGTCLVKYFNTRIPNLIAEGKTKEEASKIAGEELDSVFKREPELGYYVLMEVNQDYIIDLMGGLSDESRTQLRSLAMRQVQEYEAKYGAKEIKTVPYKPKKKNDNK